MKEINEAYEAVQSQRKAQRSGGYSASGAGYGTGYGGYQSAYQRDPIRAAAAISGCVWPSAAAI